MEWFYFWCLIHIIDTNGNSSYIRLFSRNSSPKNENAVVFLNLYEQNNILGTILVTKQLLHDLHSMKKREGGIHFHLVCIFIFGWSIPLKSHHTIPGTHIAYYTSHACLGWIPILCLTPSPYPLPLVLRVHVRVRAVPILILIEG